MRKLVQGHPRWHLLFSPWSVKWPPPCVCLSLDPEVTETESEWVGKGLSQTSVGDPWLSEKMVKGPWGLTEGVLGSLSPTSTMDIAEYDKALALPHIPSACDPARGRRHSERT